MDYPIALDPQLDVNPDDLVAAWNASPACRDLATAHVAPTPPPGFALDPQLVQQGLLLLSGAAGAAGALALDALKDALKDRLTAYFKEKLSRTPAPAVRVDAVRQPGGAYLLVVTPEKK
jgi:hypothetical protein